MLLIKKNISAAETNLLANIDDGINFWSSW